MPAWTGVITNSPLLFVCVVCTIFVPRLVTLTVAPAITESDGSVMRPTKRPCSTCADAMTPKHRITTHIFIVVRNVVFLMALLEVVGQAQACLSERPQR